MKKLFLIRHAQAGHGDMVASDRERPLTERGQRDASAMGARLAARRVTPDLIVSSPALRALTTARLMAGELGYPLERIRTEEPLYASSTGQLLSVIAGLSAELQQVMLFGHNPEFTDLAHRWSRTIVALPPCAVVELRFDVASWADVGAAAPLHATLDLA
ncbi:SixA phosphatase family protein [Piscinibacter sakaiensis]|uniref:SixA phosphatase family protein n=1 Tax=Piscinibacter sakaiensis TaxID=1547922 RepID=UPI003AAD6441